MCHSGPVECLSGGEDGTGLAIYTALLTDLLALLGALQANLAYWEEIVLTTHAKVSRVLQEGRSSD